MKNVGDNTNIGRESLKKVQTMNAFYYLNYVIYDWYKKRDSAPLSASFFLPILFLYFNVFSIIYWLSIFFNFTPPFVKSNAIAFFIALTSVSYFTLYNRSRYKEIFSQFEEKKEDEALRNLQVQGLYRDCIAGFYKIILFRWLIVPKMENSFLLPSLQNFRTHPICAF